MYVLLDRYTVYGLKFLFWGQVTVQGLFLCVLGTNMAFNLANIRYIRASTIKLFYFTN